MSIINTSVRYAKIAFSYTRRILAPFFFGIALNWIFAFVVMFGWLRSISIANSLPAMLLITLFFIGFPFLYFWLARGYAIKKGLEFIYEESDKVVSKAVGMVVSTAVNSSEKLDNLGIFKGGSGKKKGVKKAVDFIQQLEMIEDKLPRPIRRILKFVLERIPLKDFLVEIGEEMELSSANLTEIQPKVQEKVDKYVVEELIGANLNWFWGLVIINGLVMYLSWIFVIG
jgi:hypothetical protein